MQSGSHHLEQIKYTAWNQIISDLQVSKYPKIRFIYFFILLEIPQRFNMIQVETIHP